VAVDPTNPGQFFACCGLLELADRLWPGAEGWFDLDQMAFCLASLGETTDATAGRLVAELGRCRLSNTMTEEQTGRLDQLSKMKAKERAKTPGLDDEKKALEKLWREEPIVLHAPFDVRWIGSSTTGPGAIDTRRGPGSSRSSTSPRLCTSRSPRHHRRGRIEGPAAPPRPPRSAAGQDGDRGGAPLDRRRRGRPEPVAGVPDPPSGPRGVADLGRVGWPGADAWIFCADGVLDMPDEDILLQAMASFLWDHRHDLPTADRGAE
jgi:hypothetical protein